MISTLKVQTLETDLIEKIKAAIKKRAEAKAKRMFLKRPRGWQNASRLAMISALTAPTHHHRRP